MNDLWQLLYDWPRGTAESRPDYGLTTLETTVRRNRTHNHALLFVGQSIADVQRFGRLGEVLLNNTSFLFHFEANETRQAVAVKCFDYDPFTVKLLKSIKTNRPFYSECFVASPYGYGPARFFLSPVVRELLAP
jgi:conjugal transfer ATP-binding protein TraC